MWVRSPLTSKYFWKPVRADTCKHPLRPKSPVDWPHQEFHSIHLWWKQLDGVVHSVLVLHSGRLEVESCLKSLPVWAILLRFLCWLTILPQPLNRATPKILSQAGPHLFPLLVISSSPMALILVASQLTPKSIYEWLSEWMRRHLSAQHEPKCMLYI